MSRPRMNSAIEHKRACIIVGRQGERSIAKVGGETADAGGMLIAPMTADDFHDKALLLGNHN